MFEIAEEGGHITMSCPSSLTVASVGEGWLELQAVIDAAPRSVTVRTANLGRLDTALLQAFLVLKHELGRGGVPLHWAECSDEFVRAVNLLGLSEALGVVQ
jgi:anti-anti-sigma regulatory factor